MRTIQKLLGRNKKELEYDSTMGLLTKDDLEKLRKAGVKQASPHRKTTYKTWDCASCSGRFFYSVMKCPSCESSDVKESTNRTSYQMAE